MRSMRKKFKMVAIVSTLILCMGGYVFASGNAETKKSAPAASTASSKPLVFINDNPPFNKQNAAMGRWLGEQTGVSFVPESYPNLANYQTTLRQSLLSPKTAPDFFKWWSGYRLKALVDAGLVVDVSDIWQKYIKAGVWPAGAAKDLTFNGKQYAIPYNYAEWGIIYNKKVFAELHLSVPKTWPEFLDVCKKIQASGRTPLAMTLNGRWQSLIWWTEILIKTDPDLYMGIVNGTIKFADPRVLHALNQWLEVIKYLPKDETLPWEEVYPKIVSGQYPMDLLGDWLFTSLYAIGGKPKDFGWFPVPSITPKGNGFVLEVAAAVIPKNSPNVARTKKMFDAWMTLAGQKEWVKVFGESSPAGGGLIPDLDVFKTMKADGLFTNKVRDVPRWWEAVPVPLVEYSIDKFAQVILHPDPATLKSAMQDIDNFRAKMGS